MEGASRVGCRRNLTIKLYRDPTHFNGKMAVVPNSSVRGSMKADGIGDACWEVYHTKIRGDSDHPLLPLKSVRSSS
jgi:hypothetical protein